ncbi:hypothetical protein BBO99_00006290 [Phytophthora kernoviae]|uniref:Uncharacterized protein n=1 Tax=Phytophthora kernoviae TaxID=325452 RepID=A0A3R7JXX5_9STRA|nr:hypothetical protein BBI17_006415 [Phytophthora kernoviae]RLN78002.1 hypothetical protein BBO99_00006290 [Phytophthora kernoviae]
MVMERLMVMEQLMVMGLLDMGRLVMVLEAWVPRMERAMEELEEVMAGMEEAMVVMEATVLLGMNAEALNFCIGSFVHFLERIGAMCAGIASMLAPRPVFPPGHPRHGEPPVTEEEERSRLRRVRIFQFMVSMAGLTCLYKGLQWLARLRKPASKLLVAPPSNGMGRDLENIFQRTVGVKRF